MALTDKLAAIGDAIRSKTGGGDKLTLDQMPQAIANIEGGGGVKYVVGTLVPVTIEDWDEEGEGHTKTITLVGYNPGPNGIQIGMPDGGSVTNEQALLKAAVTVQQVSHTVPTSYAGKTTLTLSAVNVPDGPLTVGVFGLEECEPVAIPYTYIFLDAPVADSTKPSSCQFEAGAATCSIKWSPTGNKFNAGTAYTATITLTPTLGYKLEGVAENFFKINNAPEGTVVTNPADSGVVTAVFPATA